ncbi:MAG TPA: anti-sigma factor, partial [Candidatus Angelobacter sp.]|nr:anti-sigma factor [Candidatus Angelobacter sp.]
DQANLFVPTHTIFSWMKTFKKIGTPLKTGLIGVLLIVLLGLGWNNVHLRTIMSDYKQLTSQEPISIKPTFNLQPQNSFSQAKGVVYIVHEGKQNRLIMQVDHIPQTKGTEIFQAWLLYDGKYWSCGTFRSNQSGEGALTYLVPSTVQVEGFKITLEPHTGANQPHGPAILKAL